MIDHPAPHAPVVRIDRGADRQQLDDRGFIEVNDYLQTTTDTNIFAAGDIANMANHKLEKAGVFAVRQGMPLAENLRRSVQGVALKPYRPQKRWLALISTGDQQAVASRGVLWGLLTALGVGGLNITGAWLWRWKDWIDQRFMRRFSEFPKMDKTARKPHPIRLAAEAIWRMRRRVVMISRVVRCEPRAS